MLCRELANSNDPACTSLFILRDHEGNILRRTGKKGVGVALTSYLHGRTYMQRVKDAECEDYSTSAFKPDTGKLSSIGVYTTEKSSTPLRVLYEESVEADLRNELDVIEKRKIKARQTPTGDTVRCPECGTPFIKHHKLAVFCSAPGRVGPNGKDCSTASNNRIKGLREQLKIEDTVSVTLDEISTPAQAEVTTKPVAEQPKVTPAGSMKASLNDNITIIEPDGRTISIPQSAINALGAEGLQAIFRR